jgi:hypothetical protein
VASLAPDDHRNALLRLVDTIRNPRIAVHITVRPAIDAASGSVRDALMAAIDADDDILTKNVESGELKAQIQNAKSFDALVRVLRSARAIDG